MTMDTSRRTLALMEEEGYASTHMRRIKLGLMLLNQMMTTRETPPELVAVASSIASRFKAG